MGFMGKRTVIASRDYWAENQAAYSKNLTRPQTPSMLSIVVLYKINELSNFNKQFRTKLLYMFKAV
jgi:hypothetical protein